MMYTKIISLVAGLIMFMPLAVSAQTDTLAALQHQIAALQQQLLILQGRQSGGGGGSDSSLPTEKPKPIFERPQQHIRPGDQPEDEDTTTPITFDRNLYLGLRNDSDVSNLQEFLTDQGFYNQTISGNFFILTRNAVRKFQQAHGIRPSGYFGPATRTVANKILAGREILPTTPPPSPVGHYQNPVFLPVFADPSIIKGKDGYYYAYATEDVWDGELASHLIPIIASKDLVHWSYVRDAFTPVTRPNWKEDGGGLWAPDISFHTDGKYYLYYSQSIWGDHNPGIGVATADTPAGPFTDKGMVLRSSSVGVANSIDPHFFQDDDGTPYLAWGSFNGIYGIQLSQDGLHTVGEKFQIAGNRYEAPHIIKRNGYYYFFGSDGTCCSGLDSTYSTNVARAASFRGPYQDKDGKSLISNGGTPVLKRNEHRDSVSGKQFVGPGHNSIIADAAGDDWIVYHAIDIDTPHLKSGATKRPLMIDRILWEHGWPTVANQQPSTRVQQLLIPPPLPLPLPVSTGHLKIDPTYAVLKIGETQRIRAIFTPPRPACLANPSCKMPEQAPYEVQASFVSDNPKIVMVDEAVSTCPVPVSGIQSSCPDPLHFVRGVSEGSAVITATYSDYRTVHVARMKVSVDDGTVSQKLPPVTRIPVIYKISPLSGSIGTMVTIVGIGFVPIGNAVTFGGVHNAIVNLSSMDGKTLTFAIPFQLCDQLSEGSSALCRPLQPGIYDVSVTNINGTSDVVKFEVVMTVTQKLFYWPDTTENIHPMIYIWGGPNPPKVPTQNLLAFIANKYDVIDNLNYEQVKQAKNINSKGVYLFDVWELNGIFLDPEIFKDPVIPPLLYYDNPSPGVRSFKNVVMNRWWQRAPTNPGSSKDAFIQIVQQHLNQFGEDGIRADLLVSDIRTSGGLVTITSPNPQTAAAIWPVYDHSGNQYKDDNTGYVADMSALLSATKAAFGKKYALTMNGWFPPNPLDYGKSLDGYQRECFVVCADDLGDGRSSVADYQDWKGQLSLARGAERLQKAQFLTAIFSGSVMKSQPDIHKRRVDTPDALRARLFSLASYLLVKGQQTYFYYSTNSFYLTGPYYFPEWKIKIGTPLNDCDSIDTCKLANGLYRREFSNGIVLINPYDTGMPISFNLSTTFYKAVLSGGNDPQLPFDRGSLDTSGSLAYEAVNMVTLGPKDAVILVKSVTAQ